MYYTSALKDERIFKIVLRLYQRSNIKTNILSSHRPICLSIVSINLPNNLMRDRLRGGKTDQPLYNVYRVMNRPEAGRWPLCRGTRIGAS